MNLEISLQSLLSLLVSGILNSVVIKQKVVTRCHWQRAQMALSRGQEIYFSLSQTVTLGRYEDRSQVDSEARAYASHAYDLKPNLFLFFRKPETFINMSGIPIVPPDDTGGNRPPPKPIPKTTFPSIDHLV